MYEVLLESLKHYAEHGVGEISTYEAGQIAELLESQHAEITMLRKMQPVVLSGDSAKSFSLVLELSETKSKIEELEKENAALKAYKDYFTGCYGQGYDVANYHLNGNLEPLDSFIDGAQEAHDSVFNKEESHV